MMKKIALVSALAMSLSPVFAHAGGEVGPVLVTPPSDDQQPVAVIPGGVGGAPVVVAGGAFPIGALAAGIGAAAIVACAIACFDDDGSSTPSTTGTIE